MYLNGGQPGTIKPGDIMEYTVTVQNQGLDFADNVIVSEVVLHTNLIPGSLEIVSGPNAGPVPVEACHCVPAIPETSAYVARIMALLGGAGALAVPAFEVRLVA